MGEVVVFEFPGKPVSIQLTELNTVVLPHRQLYLVKSGNIKGVGSCLSKIWAHDDLSIQSFDEVEVWKLGVKYANSSVNERVHLPDGVTWSVGVKTVNGDCGDVYIGRFNKGWRIFAMHYMAVTGLLQQQAMGAVFTRSELEKAITSIGGTLQGVETVMDQISRKPEEIQLLPFPLKSEAWAAMTAGASMFPMGELHPPMSGATMKTRLKKSLFYDDVADLEEEFCGERAYWRFPEFRGKMHGDVWKSPFTHAFTAENKGAYSQRLMWLSVMDYLAGMSDLEVSGWATLSENQTIVGVPGSYVHGMNLQTSAGPPFNHSKRSHVAVLDKVAFVDPEVLKIYDALEEQLRHSVPAAFGICTLKDEPVKPGKNPRVFTCLSMAYNMLLKKYMAPVKSFMRANFTFFECAVGIDMTGSDAERIVRFLVSVDPSLTKLFDGDARMLDKAWCGDFFNFVAYVFYAAAWIIGVSADECYRLVLGIKHCRLAMKGDVFCVFWNPSGNDVTVELNSVLMSLLERYVYYRQNGSPVPDDLINNFVREFFKRPIVSNSVSAMLSFRKNVALATYGDDNVKAMRILPREDYCDIWKNELGIEMTDASKATFMIQKNLSEIQFLKRRFVWNEEFKRHFTPLEMKSLLRTLVMKKDSTLSDRDHACVAMSEVLRELVYHGKPLYDRFLARFNIIADKYELRRNSYLILKPFDDWVVELKAGTFMAWVPRTVVANQDVTNSDC
jgi:hypothetical protein